MAEVNAAGREGGRRREGGGTAGDREGEREGGRAGERQREGGITPLFKALSLTTQQIFSTIYLSSL